MNPYKTLADGATARAARWSVVIPAYNEEDFLPATLDAFFAQTADNARLIMVDNKSTDATRSIMERAAAGHPGRSVTILTDDRPGRIQALETGIAAVETEFAALWDADTIYPEDYLAQAERLYDSSENVAAAFAFGVYSAAGPARAWFTRTKGAVVAALLRNQGHTGGYGQTFRTSILHKTGGYSPSLWPYTVADHELAHRVAKHGRIAYDRDFWCLTSSRRKDRRRIDWTLPERLGYNLTPAFMREWFFYSYLRPRLEARKMYNANLRDRDWEDQKASSNG
ncbi:MAG: glycosyltransferase [Pseudomonadota bacterium]